MAFTWRTSSGDQLPEPDRDLLAQWTVDHASFRA
jgi:hypothetical protein